MNISLTKPLEDFVQKKVDNGMYASASEVVRAGLRVLVEQDVNLKIENGVAQADAGLGINFNDGFAQDVMQNVKKRIKTNRKQ